MPEHRYKLQFDNGPDQFVTAATSTEAVAARIGERQPHTITDLTALEEWAASRGTVQATTPLRDRIMGRFDEEQPRYFAAKELTA